MSFQWSQSYLVDEKITKIVFKQKRSRESPSSTALKLTSEDAGNFEKASIMKYFVSSLDQYFEKTF